MNYKVGRGRPPQHSRFQKGKSGNPEGARLHDPVRRALKRLTTAQIEELGAYLLTSSTKSLEAELQGASVLQTWLTNAILQGMKRGDIYTLETVLNRMVGKPKTVDINSALSLPSPHVELSPAERVAEIERLRRLRLEVGRD